MSMRHGLGQVEGASALFIAGTATPTTATSVTFTNLSPPLAMQADITATLATSVFTITINPFIGPLGGVVVFVSPTTASGIVRVDSKTYTGDSLAIVVKSFAVDGTTATDKAFDFMVWAY